MCFSACEVFDVLLAVGHPTLRDSALRLYYLYEIVGGLGNLAHALRCDRPPTWRRVPPSHTTVLLSLYHFNA